MPPTDPPAEAVYVIDGHSYIYRAQFALADIKTPRGEPCQAVLGFGNILVKLLRERRPRSVAVALDADVKGSFRQRLDPQYKANRVAPAEELVRQFAWCERLLEGLGLPFFSVPDFEADDLLATLATELVRAGHDVVVCSSDKDLGQLVRDSVWLLDLAGGLLADAAAVEARWGVRPEQLPDLFGLIGDAIDNIPGIAGFGKKTAAALLSRFTRLEDIPQQADALRGIVRGADKIAQSLREHMVRATLSRELARARSDVPLPFSPRDLVYRGPREHELVAICEELGLKAFPERAMRMLRGERPQPGRQGMLFAE